MKDVTAKVGLATSLEKQGKFQEAEALFAEVLSEMDANDPKRADILAALGGVLLEQRRYQEAENYFGHAFAMLPESDPHRKTVLVGLAASSIHQGKDDQAEAYYRQALTVTASGDNRQADLIPLVSARARHSSDEQLTAGLMQTLPPNVRDDLIESMVCLENSCWNAFGAMARRTVHSICADLGSSKGDLKDQIDFLTTNHKLNSDESRTAHEIRTLGRNGAHPEWEPVTEEMATSAWGLLTWLLKRLYEKPPASPGWSSNTRKRY